MQTGRIDKNDLPLRLVTIPEACPYKAIEFAESEPRKKFRYRVANHRREERSVSKEEKVRKKEFVPDLTVCHGPTLGSSTLVNRLAWQKIAIVTQNRKRRATAFRGL